ncbi:MAG: hypothetical protein LBN42_01495 [Oscillospiraceae bacterium]|jgi:hypothetical protein|nr:hypothetical protein [Oscillospiraceae bacterium]
MAVHSGKRIGISFLIVVIITVGLCLLNIPPKKAAIRNHVSTPYLSEEERDNAARIFSVRLGHISFDTDGTPMLSEYEGETDQSSLMFVITAADVKRASAAYTTVYTAAAPNGEKLWIVKLPLTDFGAGQLTDAYLNYTDNWFSYCTDNICYDKVAADYMAAELIRIRGEEMTDYTIDEIWLTGTNGEYRSSQIMGVSGGEGARKMSEAEAKALASKINAYIDTLPDISNITTDTNTTSNSAETADIATDTADVTSTISITE